jgi:hypothetical protein
MSSNVAEYEYFTRKIYYFLDRVFDVKHVTRNILVLVLNILLLIMTTTESPFHGVNKRKRE